VAWIQRHLPSLAAGTTVILNLSGRGDKDVDSIRARLEPASASGGGAQ
jgi:tryptophan synthase beta subunit